MSETILPSSETMPTVDPAYMQELHVAVPAADPLLIDYVDYCRAAGTDPSRTDHAYRKELAYATHEYVHQPETICLTDDGKKRTLLIKRFVTVKLDEYFRDYPYCGQKNESSVHKQRRRQLQVTELPAARQLAGQISQLHVVRSIRDALDDPVGPVVPQVLNDLDTVYVGAVRAMSRARLGRGSQTGRHGV